MGNKGADVKTVKNAFDKVKDHGRFLFEVIVLEKTDNNLSFLLMT